MLRALAVVGAAVASCGALERPGRVASPLEAQIWAARRIDDGGSCRDDALDWAKLRARLTSSDARLLVRTSAADLAVREDVVVFDVGHCRGYADSGFCVVFADGPERAAAAARVEASVRDALEAAPAERRASFAATCVECVLEEAYRCALETLGSLERSIGKELESLGDIGLPEADRAGALCRLLSRTRRRDAFRGGTRWGGGRSSPERAGRRDADDRRRPPTDFGAGLSRRGSAPRRSPTGACTRSSARRSRTRSRAASARATSSSGPVRPRTSGATGSRPGPEKGDFNVPSTRMFSDHMFQRKHPHFENLRGDDHSSKDEPK